MLNLENCNEGLIYTEIEGCIDCNKCIHECPILKSNVSVPDGNGGYKMCVDEKECILCGMCIDTCVHDVRRYRDDCDDFFPSLNAAKVTKNFLCWSRPRFTLTILTNTDAC